MVDLPETVAALLKRDGTGISWADFTFNPWIGCQKVGPACDHCYAEDLFGTEGSRLKRVVWGPDGERLMTSPTNWAKPLRWQKVLAAAAVSLDVFSASLADWADNKAPAGAREQFAIVIRKTPNLRWMLLTKRIGNAEGMLREIFPEGVPSNVALGITVVLQSEADRDIPKAIAVKKALGIKRLFLSMEPLLGPVELRPEWLDDIDLVIVGGESGKEARPMHPDWAINLLRRCAHGGVRFHFKQWGEFRPYAVTMPSAKAVDLYKVHFRPRKGPFATMERVGTKRAGRTIGGREWLDRLAA